MVFLGFQCREHHTSALLLLLFFFTSLPAEAYISIYYKETSTTIEDLPSLFGPPLPRGGIIGILVLSNPLNGCTTLDPPPKLDPSQTFKTTNFVTLIRRFECDFDTKVLHAQNAGYSAAIIHNVFDQDLFQMNITNSSIAEQIKIPSVFTSESASDILKEHINPAEGVYVIVKPNSIFPLLYYIVPFTGIVSISFIMMSMVGFIRCAQYRRKMMRIRLTKRLLKRVPIRNFCPGDKYEVCVICLDEYDEGAILRILPCSHAYHINCIDLWLTRVRKTCPVCKQRAFNEHTGYSDSDSDDEYEAPPTTVRRRNLHTEHTPLLQPTSPATSPESLGPYESAVTTTITHCLVHHTADDLPLLDPEDFQTAQQNRNSQSEGELTDDSQREDDSSQLVGRSRLVI